MNKITMKTTDIACPVCGAHDYKPHYQLKVGKIVKCQQCDVKYVTPRAEWDHLYDTINSWSEQDVNDSLRLGIAYAKSTQKMYRRFLDMVEKVHDIPGRKLLDVGCSTGAFIDVAKADWQCSGLELGKEAAEYTRQRFEIDVQQTTIADGKYKDASFDCICISEVIEHLEFPKQDMQKLYQWLKPGGSLLITTPNYDSLYRRLHGANWWVVNCEDEHIIFFNKADMHNILEDIGFEIKRVHFRGIDFFGILKTYFRKNAKDEDADTASVEADYYTERDSKERIKNILAKLGLKSLAHQCVWWLSYLFSMRSSPVYAWGEQMVVVATKPAEK